MIIKNYILDTSVYLTDYNSIYSFGKSNIYIPFKVLEEIDKHKKRQDSVGHNARSIIRVFDELREKGSLYEGISLGEDKGKIYVRLLTNEDFDSFSFVDKEDPDNQIIATAISISKLHSENETVVVSRDINMRVKCDAIGLQSEDFITNQLVDSADNIYSGCVDYYLPSEMINSFYEGEPIFADPEEILLYPNQFVLLMSAEDPNKSALAQFVSYKDPLKKLVKHKNIWGITTRNKEQNFAMNLLMDQNLPLVSLVGKAGCGKTMCAIAAGLEQVMNDETYTRLIISRPVQPLGKDIGFLPGTMEEKMLPWLAPIQDNLENLMGNDKAALEMYMSQGIIEVEALTFIRGRSISNAYIIIDEAQNLTRHELKTIITRVGENTKIVLTGDVEQIDNVYVNETSNGLAYAVEKLKNNELTGHITLNKGERSKLATLASKEL